LQIDNSTANQRNYHVFLTPKADSKGLYVINETANSFEVRESGGGTSSLSFDYRIVAKRRGYEAQRLTDVTDRYNTKRVKAPHPRPDPTDNPVVPRVGAGRPQSVAVQRSIEPATRLPETK
jgi:hypothetical protein